MKEATYLFLGYLHCFLAPHYYSAYTTTIIAMSFVVILVFTIKQHSEDLSYLFSCYFFLILGPSIYWDMF